MSYKRGKCQESINHSSCKKILDTLFIFYFTAKIMFLNVALYLLIRSTCRQVTINKLLDNSALINIILAYYHLVDPDLKVEIFFEKMG